MKTTEMPAYRLTANCIWSSFHSSTKKHIIITGIRGSGKTTLLKKLFPNDLPGITTWAEPGNAVYIKENITGQISQVGVYDPALEGLENKMRLIGNGFSTLGITALKNALQSESQWLSIDEIGYLESMCNDYLDTIAYAMGKKHIVAVVRKQNLPHIKKLCERKDIFLIDLDAPFGSIGCVIMASGLGKRFGGNKLMTDFNGMPLISHILNTTLGIFQKRIVVTRQKEIKTLCENMGVEVIFHSLPHQSDTIRLGLETMTEMKSCIFCTADQPLLSSDTVTSLALLAVNESFKIVRPVFEKTPGSPVIFPKCMFEELLHLPANQSGGYVIKQHSEDIQYLSIDNPYELEDIDTPEDLVHLQQLSQSIYTQKSW